jgi:DNA-binding MarR family transcriptional regulator
VLRATAAGLRAREIWRPLPGLIEQRWQERFGADQLGRLRGPLTGMVGRLDPGLPDCLPILGAALLSQGPDPRLPPRPDGAAPEAMPLSALLSRVLLSFAVEYEREAGLSLAVAANVLRVLGTDGTRLRDLPALTGTSKESIRWALGILTRGDLAAEEPDPAASRGKVARLTPRGLDAQRLYHELTSEIERRWHDRFTPAETVALRASLEPLAARQPLSGGLEPYPDNWRALVRRPDVLPHFPVVLHRGGYPDGS